MHGALSATTTVLHVYTTSSASDSYLPKVVKQCLVGGAQCQSQVLSTDSHFPSDAGAYGCRPTVSCISIITTLEAATSMASPIRCIESGADDTVLIDMPGINRQSHFRGRCLALVCCTDDMHESDSAPRRHVQKYNKVLRGPDV